MPKVLRCRDIGFDCDYVVRAETEEEILKKAAEHAQTAHDMKEISEEVAAKVRAAIRHK
ncbi:MAG: DUF1059 domain-containing protein [Candidatus Binatia bacterium]